MNDKNKQASMIDEMVEQLESLEADAEEMADNAEVAVEEASAEAKEGPDRIEQLEAELNETKNQLLRQVAEFKNFRRRMEKERNNMLQLGQVQVIRPLLDVLDDFRRSLEASEQMESQQESGPAYDALKQGLDLVYQKFSDELIKLGVEPIEAIGQPFDEHQHEAMMQMPVEDDSVESGTVVEELQRGYRLGDRVLRHSRVIVSA